ncbi:abc transporter BEA3 [Hyphodiscus hymeniophilus]|uniref:Abc transporter BEA3 n=1 Tax=Hyphodiscus hymeniophilus TaxID=353542 RepID=A0A9P6VMH4_9HELO|nr:abc transporter BEA3 [Hyphodiscus hymeniophilus]
MDGEKDATVDLSTSAQAMKTEEAGVDIEAFPITGDSPSKAEDPDEQQTDYSSKAENKTTFSDYLRIFTYSTLNDRILLSIAFFGEIATGTTLPLMNIVFGHLVGNFSDYFSPHSTTTKAQFEHSLSQQTLYIVYLFIARWILSYISMLIFRMAGIRMSAKLRFAYLKALFSLPVQVLDTLPSGMASNTITTSANVIQVGVSDKLGTFIQFSSLLVAAIIVAFLESWALTLVTSSVIVFIGVVYGSILPVMIKMNKQVEHADGQASSIAGEVLGSVRMIVACGAESRIARKYAGWIEESRRRGLRISPLMGAQYAPLFFSIYATMALCFWFGFKLYLEGHIDSVGTIVIVLTSVMMIAFSIGQTAAPVIAASKAAGAAADFFAIIDAPKPSIHGLKEPEVSALDELQLKSIDFAYPSRPHVKVLDDLSLNFEPGKITAIVGASGSGKSTIVGLIERWYDLSDNKRVVIPESRMIDKDKKKGSESDDQPDSMEEKDVITKPRIALKGSIFVGDKNLSAVDLKWWRAQIGLVQQEPFIFNSTISQNIEYGLIGSQWETESPEIKRGLVEEACKEAFADEFITRLPLGYMTVVGDAGIKLSGGQRQRLAIARSIVKRPKILILDEATSSIDVRGERLVQAALDKVSEGRTTITIAHRLSTIKKADKIVVMQKGRVIEEGNHKSLLLNPDGAYWALVNAQQLSMDESFPEQADKIQGLDAMDRIYSARSGKVDEEERETYKRKSFFTSFGALLYEQRGQWLWYAVLISACMGAGAAFPVQAYLFAQLVTVVELVGTELANASSHWALMFFVLALCIGFAYYWLGWSSNTVSTNVACNYRQQYFESILAKPIEFFDAEDNSSGTLTARVANDPTQLQQLLGINMAMVLQAIFSLIGCVIIAFYFGWKLTLVAVFVALPIVMGGAFFRFRFEIQFEKLNQEVFAESSKFAAEAIGAFRTVTSLTLEDMITNRYEVLLQDHVQKAFKKARFSSMVFALSDSVNLLCMALTFYYGGTLLASGEYGPVQFFVVYIAVVNGAESAGSFLSFGPNFAQASQAANRILSFRIPQKQGTKATSELQDTEGGVKIELRDLWFKYPTRDIPIFTGLNLSIEKGQFAALVGPSGCGKTSIVSLLERFYSPQQGQILCNGVNIENIDTKEYRKAISLVAQEPTLYKGTIKENILLGVTETTTQEALYQACREAEIHDFIMSLPDGYSSEVGSKGINLSGGQKQRISIARALIRDPKILLLDEATSSLDSESEKLVQKAFEKAGKNGRTMVVVAHRLATVQNADIIFVIGDGKVLEKGDHNALLRQKGVYYQMCQSQALDR